jgi:hypothetical protein
MLAYVAAGQRAFAKLILHTVCRTTSGSCYRITIRDRQIMSSTHLRAGTGTGRGGAYLTKDHRDQSSQDWPNSAIRAKRD